MIERIMDVAGDPYRIRTYRFTCDKCGTSQVMPVYRYKMELGTLLPELMKNDRRKCGDKWCCPICAQKYSKEGKYNDGE